MNPLATSGVNWAALWAILPAGVVLGFAYNLLIHWLEVKGYAEDLTWLEVVGGCAFTIALCIPLVGLEATLAVFTIFASTGLFMALGAVYRAVQKREALKKFHRGEE